MKKILLFTIIVTLLTTGCKSNKIRTEKYDLEVDKGLIYGTLALPKGEGPFPVVIIIGGSGPTDRDGNNPISGDNNSLKMIAEHLANNGIASIRYDKRGIAESMGLVQKEEELVFEDYVEDAIEWVEKVQEDDRFNKYFILGHSEGAQIGGIAASKLNVDGFVSIAGMGESAYDTLVRQIKDQPGDIFARSLPILDELNNGKLVDNPPGDLAALFRPSVQPYLISWFKYDPKDTIIKIDAPVLIIQGDTDLQVGVKDAQDLYMARVPISKAPVKLVVVEGMNHILKDAPLDKEENFKTYSDPKLSLNEELKNELINFINDY